jgi:hypothetical protein
MTDMQELIDGVKAHAQENYEAGWDVIVECYEDDQIKGMLLGADKPVTTVLEAIEEVRPVVSIWVSRVLDTRPGEDSDGQLVMYNNYLREEEASKKAIEMARRAKVDDETVIETVEDAKEYIEDVSQRGGLNLHSDPED